MTGTTIEEPTLFKEKPKSHRVKGDLIIVLTFLCAIAGTIFSLGKSKRAKHGACLSGGLAIVLLLFWKIRIDNAMVEKGMPPVQVSYEIGFWLALLSYAAGTWLNAVKTPTEEHEPSERWIVF